MKRKNKKSLADYILAALERAAVNSAYNQRHLDEAMNKFFRRYGWPVNFRGSYGRQTLTRLNKRGLVNLQKQGPNVEVSLTAKGQTYLKTAKFNNMQLVKLPWDGRWRIVVFDIPEKYKLKRDAFRDKLKSLGFVQIQRSVWVTPRECTREIATVCSYYEVQPYVTLIEGKYLGNDSKLKKMFGI